MEKKKVVSIEDRIPKLKQARKKKANRRLVFYLSIFLVLISIIVYLQSPLSHVREINVSGNKIISEETIVDKTDITEQSNIWTLNSNAIKKEIEKSSIIKSVEVSRKLPFTVSVIVEEYKIVGYVKSKESYDALLENGKVVKSEKDEFKLGDAPLINSFKNDENLERIAKELSVLPNNIFDLISEVNWTPSKNNPHKIKLYMNDGFIVASTTRGFSENMKAYPSIVSQLDENAKGVIHIGVGSYFERKK